MPVIVAFESAPWGPRRMGTGRGAGLGSSVHPGLGDWSTDGDPATTGSVKAVLREPLPSKQIWKWINSARLNSQLRTCITLVCHFRICFCCADSQWSTVCWAALSPHRGASQPVPRGQELWLHVSCTCAHVFFGTCPYIVLASLPLCCKAKSTVSVSLALLTPGEIH